MSSPTLNWRDPDAEFKARAAAEFTRELADSGKSLERLIGDFRQWLYLPDAGPVSLVLSAVAANRLEGDPVWLLVVGPPGSGKTEVLQTLSELPHVHPAATITEAALLSGTPRRERANDSSGGLLRAVGGFGFILLKDFTSVLAMHRDTRASVLAALREVYDGAWTRHVGVDGGRVLHWAGKLALLAGCTPAIDSHHAVMASMGERFLLYRLPEIEADELAGRALSHPGKERKMRAELAAAVREFFDRLSLPEMPPAPEPAEREWLISLSTLVVRCRSAVERDGRTREIELVPDAEAPGRLALALSQLLAGMKVVGVSEPERFRLIRKVAFDCIPALRRKVFDVLATERRPMSTTDIATRTDHPTITTRRALEDLACHRLIKRTFTGQGKADLWEITEWAEMRVHAIDGASPKCQ